MHTFFSLKTETHNTTLDMHTKKVNIKLKWVGREIGQEIKVVLKWLRIGSSAVLSE